MRAVDLFCGCGGLSLGFLRAGIEIVSAFDNWDDALNVYRTNFRHPAIKCDLSNIEEAVNQITPLNPDMIIGGPPCQDFSSAGLRDENNGRGDLTVSYANIISRVHPEWFVMENVSRILQTQKLVDAVNIFKEAGYGLTYTVLNAARCGVPQKRKRFVMIGRLGEEDNFILDEILGELSDHEMTVAEYLGDQIDINYYYRHPRSYVRRGIFSIHEPSPTIRGVNRPMPNGYQLHQNDPVADLEGIRPLTTIERALIQTFPRDFCFTGSKTDQEQMIGNAVPVNLGKYVGLAIQRFIGEIEPEDLSLVHRIIGHHNIPLAPIRTRPRSTPVVHQVKFNELAEQYPDEIVNNPKQLSDCLEKSVACIPVDTSKNVLISIVKADNIEQYLDQSAKVYYTGKRFPSTIALNKLYYFMPYLKGKGIRDLYLIRIARIGNRKEGQQGEDKNDIRLVFEIEFLGNLFSDYMSIDLDIWHAFTDTTMYSLLQKKKEQESIQFGLRSSQVHKKLMLAYGNAFDVDRFKADGIAAFVKAGFTGTDAAYSFFKEEQHQGIKVEEYIYGEVAPHKSPTPDTINEVVADVLDKLVAAGASRILIPPVNVQGVNNYDKDELVKNAIANWLNTESGTKAEQVMFVEE